MTTPATGPIPASEAGTGAHPSRPATLRTAHKGSPELAGSRLSSPFDTEAGFQTVPDEPGPLLEQWFEDAMIGSNQPNWNALHLATVAPDGRPSVRPVLMKYYDIATCRLSFFTNYTSRKALEIEANRNVAAGLHWDHLERVIRFEGTVDRSSTELSDEYFATRHRESQIGAWASAQSHNLDSWESLLERIFEYSTRFAGGPVPRPPHWGGYDLTPTRIEFWLGRPSRIHERLIYERDDASAATIIWRTKRLYP